MESQKLTHKHMIAIYFNLCIYTIAWKLKLSCVVVNALLKFPGFVATVIDFVGILSVYITSHMKVHVTKV